MDDGCYQKLSYSIQYGMLADDLDLSSDSKILLASRSWAVIKASLVSIYSL